MNIIPANMNGSHSNTRSSNRNGWSIENVNFVENEEYGEEEEEEESSDEDPPPNPEVMKELFSLFQQMKSNPKTGTLCVDLRSDSEKIKSLTQLAKLPSRNLGDGNLDDQTSGSSASEESSSSSEAESEDGKPMSTETMEKINAVLEAKDFQKVVFYNGPHVATIAPIDPDTHNNRETEINHVRDEEEIRVQIKQEITPSTSYDQLINSDRLKTDTSGSDRDIKDLPEDLGPSSSECVAVPDEMASMKTEVKQEPADFTNTSENSVADGYSDQETEDETKADLLTHNLFEIDQESIDEKNGMELAEGNSPLKFKTEPKVEPMSDDDHYGGYGSDTYETEDENDPTIAVTENLGTEYPETFESDLMIAVTENLAAEFPETLDSDPTIPVTESLGTEFPETLELIENKGGSRKKTGSPNKPRKKYPRKSNSPNKPKRKCSPKSDDLDKPKRKSSSKSDDPNKPKKKSKQKETLTQVDIDDDMTSDTTADSDSDATIIMPEYLTNSAPESNSLPRNKIEIPISTTVPCLVRCRHCDETKSVQIHYHKEVEAIIYYACSECVTRRTFMAEIGVEEDRAESDPELKENPNFVPPKYLEEKVTFHNSCRCYTCGIAEANSLSLYTHIYEFHKISKCQLCTKGRNFPTPLTLNEHVVKHANRCDKNASKLPIISTESRMRHCMLCGEQFNSADLRFRHEQKVHELRRRRFRCIHCSEIHESIRGLVRHTEMHKKGLTVVCQTCQMVFATKKTLEVHIMRVHRERPKKFLCEFCGLGCKDRYALQTHSTTHRDEKMFECGTCHKRYARKSSLNIHLRKHLGVKPYSCELCGKGFFRADNMKTHMKVHRNRSKKRKRGRPRKYPIN